MTKHECRMTKKVFPGTCRGVCRGERLTNCFGVWHKRRYNAFTLIELTIAIAIIIDSGWAGFEHGWLRAKKKGQRARAETEIAAISAACENYKADNGVYPRGTHTDKLDAPGTEIRGGHDLAPAPCPDPLDPLLIARPVLSLHAVERRFERQSSDRRKRNGKDLLCIQAEHASACRWHGDCDCHC